jgi:hypothetical protein
MEPQEIRKLVPHILNECMTIHGGIKMLVLDGIADMVASPNDEEESFDLVRELLQLSSQYQTGIMGVLHLNPGKESDKVRGHVGSQAERKAETILVSEKQADNSVIVYTKYSRHREITKRDAPRMVWCDTFGGFVSAPSDTEAVSSAQEEATRKLAVDLFAVNQSLSYSDAIERIMQLTGKSVSTCKRKLGQMREGDFVKVQPATGFYSMGEQAREG